MSRVDLCQPWTPREFALLKELWFTHTAGQLTRKLPGRSRSAILGKVHRAKPPFPPKTREWRRIMSRRVS